MKRIGLMTAFAATLAFGYVHAARAATPFVARPNILAGASNVDFFDYPIKNLRTATDPQGNVYSIASGNILKISPSGTNTLVRVFAANKPQAYATGNTIVYSNGYLWFSAPRGYIRMLTDGSQGIYHQRAFDPSTVAGPDGIYMPENFVCAVDALERPFCGPAIARTSLSFNVTYYAVVPAETTASQKVGPLIFARDGNLYFFIYNDSSAPGASPYSTLGKLSAGNIRVATSANSCGSPFSMENGSIGRVVISGNALYFLGENGRRFALCQTTFGGVTTALTPEYAYANLGNANINNAITADDSGNIWIADLVGPGLYSFNVAAKQLGGPYDPAVIGAYAPPFFEGTGQELFTGPDRNIYFFTYDARLNQNFLSVFVRHAQSVLPSAIGLSPLLPYTDFYVTEPLARSGPWTAVSLNPAVATISIGSALIGRFKVTEAGIGSTSIVVTDAYGNVVYVPVTVTN